MYLPLLASSFLILLVNSLHFAPEVNIESGRIRGILANLTTGDVVRKYLGIPYAKALRFKPPTNVEKTFENMSTFGKECPQHHTTYSDNDISEDCLNLNVFLPHATNGDPLAVMVWIHGGAYVYGSNRIYDGSYISVLGKVIVVAINYRLTVFGFLTTGGTGDLKGNYGMLDQIQALKWVKRNIAQFGGDPNKVTIFGESAGGASVSLLMLSPLTKGLFQNVIMQSGAASAKWAAISYEETKHVTRSFGDRIGCTNLDAMDECLKTKSFMEILNATEKGFSFVPVIDGHFLKDDPKVLLRKGKFEKYNVMVGVTDDEGFLVTTAIPGMSKDGMDVTKGIQRKVFEETVRSKTMKFFLDQTPPLPAAMIYRYTDWTNVSDPYRNRRMFIDMISDIMFTAPAIQSANAFVNHSLRTYFYQLQHRAEYNTIFGVGRIPSFVGSYHTADLWYLFGFPFKSRSLNLKDTTFSRDIIRLWTNFAKTGKPTQPNNSAPVAWPQYDLKNEQYLALKPNMTIEAKLRPEYMAFWNNFAPEALRSMPSAKPCDVSSEAIENIPEIVAFIVIAISLLLHI